MKSASGLAAGLFVVTAVLAALIAVALYLGEPAGAHGSPHPEVAHMLRGGDAESHPGHLLWIGWGVGTLQILFFVGALALGARKKEGLRGLGRPLTVAGAAYIAAWTGLVVAYYAYARGEATELVFALPVPTAIMLYVMWPLPVIFVAYFSLGFRRYILNDDDLRKFRRIVALRSARGREAE